MAALAPKCQQPGCGNRTWKVYCHVHRKNRDTSGNKPRDQVASVSRAGQRRSGDVWGEISFVFPGIRKERNVNSVRDQIENTVREAVSAEISRQAVKANPLLADDLRNEANTRCLESIFSALESYQNAGSLITQDEAIELSRSSIDEHGRGLSESSALVSYGLISEWRLAKQIGAIHDPHGVEYGNSCDKYLEHANRSIRFTALQQFQANHASLFPHIEVENTSNYQSQSKKNSFHSTWSKIGLAGLTFLDYALDTSGSRKRERQKRSEEASRNYAYRRNERLVELQTEYLERERRKHIRRRMGYPGE